MKSISSPIERVGQLLDELGLFDSAENAHVGYWTEIEPTDEQRRLLRLERQQPGRSDLLLMARMDWRGLLDPSRAERAVCALMAAQPALRLSMTGMEEETRLALLDQLPPPPLFFYRVGKAGATERLLQDYLAKEQSQGFVPGAPLFRLTIIELAPDHFTLLLAMHHAVSDAWSLVVFLRDFARFYGGASLEPIPWHATPPPRKKSKPTSPERKAALKARWLRRLCPAYFETRKADSQDSSQAAFLQQVTDADTLPRLKSLALERDLSVFSLVTTAFALVLGHYLDKRYLPLLMPNPNRRRHQRDEIGFFAYPTLLPVDLNPTWTVQTLSESLRREWFITLKDSVPFAELWRWLQENSPEPRLEAALGVFFSYFELDRIGPKEAAPDGVTLDAAILPRKQRSYPFFLTATEIYGRVFLSLEYDPVRFPKAMLEGFFADYLILLSRLDTATLDTPLAELTAALTPRPRLALAASFSIGSMPRYFQTLAMHLPNTPQVVTTGYQQIFQDLLSPDGVLRSPRNLGRFIALRLEDFIPATDLGAAKGTFSQPCRHHADQLLDTLCNALRHCSQPVWICVCPPSLHRNPAVNESLERESRRLAEKLSRAPTARCLTWQQVLAWYPLDAAAVFDPSTEALANLPYSDAFQAVLVSSLGRAWFRWRYPAPKVIVLDCDNTLWAGVVGEDGASGVRLDAAHLALQRQLLAREDAGALLALCSKNHEADVFAVLERPDMLLRKEHLAAWRIDWRAKSANLRSLAAELNLGLENFCFIDDNPLECAEVRHHAPEVMVLELPREAERIAHFLDDSWFETGHHSAEDQQRTRYYQQEHQRRQLRGQLDTLEEFLARLNLRIDITPLAEADVERVAQLTQRTNQFNTTLKREQAAAIEQRLHQTQKLTLCVRVSDRFGDYGLCGALLGEWQGDELCVELLLLSCRVLGRGVAEALVAATAQQARRQKVPWIRVSFVVAERNLPVRHFLRQLSTVADGEATDTDYRFSVEGLARIDPKRLLSGAWNSPAESSTAASIPPSPRSSQRQLEAFVAWQAMHLRDLPTLLKVHGISEKPNRPNPNGGDLAERLAAIWGDVLGIAPNAVGGHFFDDLGGDSLQAVSVMARMQAVWRRKLDFNAFYLNPTFEACCKLLEDAAEVVGQASSDFSDDAKLPADFPAAQALQSRMESFDVVNGSGATRNRFRQSTRRVLITGATGGLGAYLLHELASQTGDTLVCLVRADNEAAAARRIHDNLDRYGLSLPTSRLEVLAGDVAAPRMGLLQAAYAALSEGIDAVYHAAAMVDFLAPYSRLKATNVDGTLAILRFAGTGRAKSIHYISTTAVADSPYPQAHLTLQEVDLPAVPGELVNGYTQSKWVAERLMALGRQRGLDVTIYRPGGMTAADHIHAQLNPSEVLTALMLAVVELDALPDLDAQLDFVPLDYAARAIAQLSQTHGADLYHLVHPQPITLTELARILRRFGYQMPLIPYPEFVRRLQDYAQEAPNPYLKALLPLFVRPPDKPMSWLELALQRARFASDNSVRDLVEPCPPFDHRQILRFALLCHLTNEQFAQAGKPLSRLTRGEGEGCDTKPAGAPHVVILTANTGNGHNATAWALTQGLADGKMRTTVVTLDDLSPFQARANRIYNHLARHDPGRYPIYHDLIDHHHTARALVAQRRRMAEQVLARYRPDLIISVHALASAMAPDFKALRPDIPMLGCVTDWLGGSLHGWGDPAQDLIYCPSARSAEYLHGAVGTPAEKLRIGHLVLAPAFSSAPPGSPDLNRRHNTDPAKPCLLFNTYGDENCLPLLIALKDFSPLLHVKVLGHRNRLLRQQLESHQVPDMQWLDWTDDMPRLLTLADVVFTRPGPASVIESLLSGARLLLDLTRPVMPQEQEIVEYLLDRKWAQAVQNSAMWPRSLESALAKTGRAKAPDNLKNGLAEFCELVAQWVCYKCH